MLCGQAKAWTPPRHGLRRLFSRRPSATVLVVEDEPDVAWDHPARIERCSHLVTQAPSFREGSNHQPTGWGIIHGRSSRPDLQNYGRQLANCRPASRVDTAWE